MDGEKNKGIESLPTRVAGTDLSSVPIIRKRDDFSPTLTPSDPDCPFVDPMFESADDALTHSMGVLVFTCYPGWPWRVWGDHKQGCVFITMDGLMGARDHIVIPLRRMANEGEAYTHVLNECGNFLERWNLPRGPYDQDKFVEALNSIPAHRRYYGAIPT